MVGGKFLRHPPFQPFKIKVIDRNHPSTDFLPEIWEWEDECYYHHYLNPDIHVLLAVDLTTIEDEQRDEYPDKIFGDLFPLAWCHQFDGGREWYTALGHSPEHYSDSLFRKHLKGGIEWVLEMDEMHKK
jgi:type 1 glutamine amidotransferase